MTRVGQSGDRQTPEVGSLWERDDEVFRVELVYDAKQSVKDDSQPSGYRYDPITLVKHICVEPMPNHSPLHRFLELYQPYDPEAE